MANELTINLPTINYTKDPFNENVTPGILTVTVAGINIVHLIRTCSTGDATLVKAGIVSYGYVYLKNKDTTNNITIGSDGTLYPYVLKPGEFAMVRWNQGAIHAKASAGTPNLECWAVEN